ncbi:MAG TPA: 1,4-dihydroxy-2-naphthoate polyprenyltransferase [Acidimicrobiales bacterium]|nr:1,4-dihydroxy-2-naphthoate polyprenyltransferase [Acidimicrobiales bacterium]
MATVTEWIDGARPRTLPAAVVPVAVGTAVAVGDGVIAWRIACALVVSLALQVGVNYANDYSDGVRGTDDDEHRVGPVRLVGQKLARPRSVKLAAFGAFGVAGLAGLALAAAVGWELVVVGVAAIAAAWFYTGGSHPYGYAGYGELFVFFGVVATVGSAYVNTGALTWVAFAASIPVGFLATALLVVNNLRDIPGDTKTGKHTLAVRMGDRATRWLHTALLVGSLVGVVVVALVAGRPWGVLGVLGAVVAVPAVRAVLGGATGKDLIPVLGATGRTQLVTGLLFALGLALT